MPEPGEGMPTGSLTFGPIMFLVMAVVILIPFWMIFQKAGHSKWLSLLTVTPLVNVITLSWLAFST